MSKKLIICGDTHLQIQEPHFSAGKEFIRWFLNQDFDREENILIHLGDVYHHASPNPKVHELGISWFQDMKFHKKYVLAGNHCYNRAQDSYSIDPLQNVDRVEIFNTLQTLDIEKFKCLIMPFIYDNSRGINKTQKEFYEELKDTSFNHEYDFIFHHLQDSTIKFSEYDESGIDLTWLQGEIIGGHIHKKQKGYLGSPLITRRDEAGKDSYILLIDLETKEKEYIEIPVFLDYEDLDYNENCPDTPRLRIYDIKNAPSKAAAEEKFNGLHIRNVEVKKSVEELKEQTTEEKESKTVKEHFNNFCNREKINKKLRAKLQNYIMVGE